MSKRTILSIVFPLLFAGLVFSNGNNKTKPRKQITVVIDAGHGGKDPGKLKGTSGNKDEKHLSLPIALKLGEYIKKHLPEVKVIYTRTTDKFVSLEKRVQIANSNNANYFISIHCNSSPNKSASGTETHVHNRNSKTSIKLANMIEKQFKYRADRKSRGVKDRADRHKNLFVLKDSRMPAVLVETGFLSHSTEEKYLNSSKGQDLTASAIFRAFRDYVVKYDGVKYVKDANGASSTTPVASTKTIYKIQITASISVVPMDHPQFKKLGMKVEERDLGKGTYRYKYYVGSETDKKAAKKIMKEVREKGFKDAYIVAFKPTM
jgi:N-acetylmuramoyl-L-alanine amidase